ncbi:MAG: hypothetical protein EOL87_07680 [Spartobacteria bacterium]|nr:hypothetical protein [Spartobacteria bacterium]
MLHGTSNYNKWAFTATSVYDNEDKSKKTYFGNIRPVQITLDLFSTGVQQNQNKPKLNDDEQQRLDLWLEKRGL